MRVIVGDDRIARSVTLFALKIDIVMEPDQMCEEHMKSFAQVNSGKWENQPSVNRWDSFEAFNLPNKSGSEDLRMIRRKKSHNHPAQRVTLKTKKEGTIFSDFRFRCAK
jgi:hypothetical protein